MSITFISVYDLQADLIDRFNCFLLSIHFQRLLISQVVVIISLLDLTVRCSSKSNIFIFLIILQINTISKPLLMALKV